MAALSSAPRYGPRKARHVQKMPKEKPALSFPRTFTLRKRTEALSEQVHFLLSPIAHAVKEKVLVDDRRY